MENMCAAFASAATLLRQHERKLVKSCGRYYRFIVRAFPPRTHFNAQPHKPREKVVVLCKILHGGRFANKKKSSKAKESFPFSLSWILLNQTKMLMRSTGSISRANILNGRK